MKLGPDGAADALDESLPPRERGLKPLARANRGAPEMSLPPRERGLKPAWIVAEEYLTASRSPRGSAD